MKCLFDYCREWRLEINVKKSGVMVECEEKDRERLEGEYNSDLLPLVNEYKYLGIWFNKKWVWNNHIDYTL